MTMCPAKAPPQPAPQDPHSAAALPRCLPLSPNLPRPRPPHHRPNPLCLPPAGPQRPPPASHSASGHHGLIQITPSQRRPAGTRRHTTESGQREGKYVHSRRILSARRRTSLSGQPRSWASVSTVTSALAWCAGMRSSPVRLRCATTTWSGCCVVTLVVEPHPPQPVR